MPSTTASTTATALFAPGSSRRYGVVARGLAALVVLRVGLWDYWSLADQPEALFRPVWVVGWLDRMPSAPAFVVLQVVGVSAAALAAITKRKARWAAFVTAWLVYLVLAGLRSSLGKILHNDVLLLLAAVPFLFPIDDEDDADCGWPVRTAMAVVAGAYFFAGLSKLKYSGLDWVTGDNMRYILSWGVIDGRSRFDGAAAWVANQPWLATASAAAVMALELGAPVAILIRPLRLFFAAAAVGLHGLTWVLLGLDYWAWIGVVAVVLVDWDRLALRSGR